MTQSKTNIAALTLMRRLRVSWKAAWLLKHKLMEVMTQREADRPLEDDVRVDDAYLGSAPVVTRGAVLPTRRCSSPPSNCARAVRNGCASIRSMASRSPLSHRGQGVQSRRAALSCRMVCWVRGARTARLYAQGRAGAARQGRHRNRAVQVAPRRAVELETALSGTHHAFKFAKYARRYLAEVQYRFNRRSDMAAMLPCMAVAVTHTRSCSKRRMLETSEVKA